MTRFSRAESRLEQPSTDVALFRSIQGGLLDTEEAS
jgi:hypothetical protein